MTRPCPCLAATLALCLSLGACTPGLAAPLVEFDVVDRDRGHWLETVRHRGQPCVAWPAHRA